MSERKKIDHKYCKGVMVMSKYDTEADAERAVADVERYLRCLSECSLYEIIQELAPYRAECAKKSESEYKDKVRRLASASEGN